MAKGKYEYWLSDDGLLLLQGWARSGLTDEQIAHNMGIAWSTLKEWKNKYSAISAALKKNKDIVDLEVENALLKSAEGYDVYEEVWERQWSNKLGDFELVLTKRTKKHIPPNQTAQIFWLKNRKPQMWRDKVESHVTATSESTVKTIADLILNPEPVRDLAELIKEAKENDDGLCEAEQ